MRKLRTFLCLVLAAPLAGASRPYVPPAGGVALSLENHTHEKHLLAHIYAGMDACDRAQSIGEVEDRLSTTVNPDRVVTLSLRGPRADISDPNACAVFFSFRPRRGFSYRASLQLYDGRCRLGFSSVELANHAPGSAERVLRSYQTPILPWQGVCHKLDALQRASLGL